MHLPIKRKHYRTAEGKQASAVATALSVCDHFTFDKLFDVANSNTYGQATERHTLNE